MLAAAIERTRTQCDERAPPESESARDKLELAVKSNANTDVLLFAGVTRNRNLKGNTSDPPEGEKVSVGMDGTSSVKSTAPPGYC